MSSTQGGEVHFSAGTEPVAEAATYAFALQAGPFPLHGDNTGGANAGASAAEGANLWVDIVETVSDLPRFQAHLYTLLFFCIMSAIMAMTAIWIEAMVRVITVMSITRP